MTITAAVVPASSRIFRAGGRARLGADTRPGRTA